MDEVKLKEWAWALGVEEGQVAALFLSRQAAAERQELLLAAVPTLHGLQVWIKGTDIHLLDNRGFICSTQEPGLALSLCRLESIMGPGAVRTLVQREPLDPFAAIAVFAPVYRRVPAEVKKKAPPPKAPRSVLSAEAFSAMMKEL